MDQEQFQGIMLEQMARITQEITELRLGQDDLRKGQDDLRKGYGDLRKGQDDLRKGQDDLRKGYGDLRKGQDDLCKVQDDLRKGQDDLRKGQDDLYRGQEKIAQRIVVIEKDMHDKFGVLFDFVDKQNHVNAEILYDLKGLHNKIDRLELETAHVRRVK